MRTSLFLFALLLLAFTFISGTLAPCENVNEVMYKIGHSDPKAFRTTFRKITGLSPIQYRNKYNRETAYEN